MQDRAAGVRAAANTAASWARARRAAWQDAEATLAAIAPEADAPEPDRAVDQPDEAMDASKGNERGWSVGRLIGRLRPGRPEE